MPKPVTAEILATLERNYQHAMRIAELSRERRNQAVRQALRENKTQAWVARAIGHTRARVGQIAGKEQL